MASTQEIEKAIANLTEDTLRSALKLFQEETTGDRKTLLSRYQEVVLRVGLKNFLGKLKEKEIKNACKAVALDGSSDMKANIQSLEDKLSEGVTGLLDKADEDLLKMFCKTLGLESSDRADMIKQIADEVMLTGMESFLNKLTSAILKSHCTEMTLPSTGSKNQLVEKLMVHIFELEPLEEEKSKSKKDKKKPAEKSKGKESKKETKKETKKDTKKETKASQKKSPTKSPTKKVETKASPSKKRKREEKPAKVADKKAKVAKPAREKFVAPPLTTITKGKFDNFTDLYDNFNLPDLQKYCKENSLKVSGKKKDTIKRIISYLDTGIAEVETKKRKRGAKSGPPVKKQKTSATKKKAEPKENGKSKESSKAE